jgi:hypothetical protein
MKTVMRRAPSHVPMFRKSRFISKPRSV